MLKLHHFILLVALSVDGGTVLPQPGPPKPDGGAGAGSASAQGRDGGVVEPKPVIMDGTPWPDKPRLLTTLDGRAIVAARAAIWDLTDLFVKNDKRFEGHC